MATRMSRATPVVEAEGDPIDGPASTRQRILDIALDLFTEKGYDKTSLREIAAELGFSKAAVYYHFASKDDILMALHLRLHEFGRRAIEKLGQTPGGTEPWGRLLDQMIDEMLANRKIFVMHERNRAAFEVLHRKGHDQDHDDLQEQFRRVLGDPAVPLRDRVRLACALGSVMTCLVLSGEVFEGVPTGTLGQLLREAVRDVLGQGTDRAARAGGGGGHRSGRVPSGRVRAHERP